MTHPFERDILYTHRPADFCYDVFDAAGLWIASARTPGAGDDAADEVQYARILEQPPVQSLCAPSVMQILASEVIPFSEAYPNPEALVIRGEDPTRVSAVLAQREEINARQRCLLCGGDHSAEDCPRIHPIDVTPLLLEVDALLEQLTPHPGPNCYCPDCMRRAVVLTATSYVTKLRFDAGLICQYCGDDHADTTCPQRRSLLAPRVCGNCQGQHSIQACPEIRAALFAA